MGGRRLMKEPRRGTIEVGDAHGWLTGVFPDPAEGTAQPPEDPPR
jgi:hypothetical protein